MLRLLAIAALIWATLEGRMPGVSQQHTLLSQPEFIAGALIALLLAPTIRNTFD